MPKNCIAKDTLKNDQQASNQEEACDTLTVKPLPVAPSISKVFSPNPVAIGAVSALTFTLTNPNASTMTGVSFSDTFPAGLVLASLPNSPQCGGTVSSTSTSVTLSDGVIPASGHCTVTVGVTASSWGTYFSNSLPAVMQVMRLAES